VDVVEEIRFEVPEKAQYKCNKLLNIILTLNAYLCKGNMPFCMCLFEESLSVNDMSWKILSQRGTFDNDL